MFPAPLRPLNLATTNERTINSVLPYVPVRGSPTSLYSHFSTSSVILPSTYVIQKRDERSETILMAHVFTCSTAVLRTHTLCFPLSTCLASFKRLLSLSRPRCACTQHFVLVVLGHPDAMLPEVRCLILQVDVLAMHCCTPPCRSNFLPCSLP